MEVMCVWAQEVEHPADSVQKTKIFIENSDKSVVYKEQQREVMSGNVKLRLDSSYLFCDTAFYLQSQQTLEAFGNVRMEQGDTVFVYGKYLFYDGNMNLAQLRHQVRMVSLQQDSSEVILYTDSLDYDLETNIGYYFDHGRIVDRENELVSIYGQY
jgi:lipopolysaccharide assembly outer membrane protein LptD (OstA)